MTPLLLRRKDTPRPAGDTPNCCPARRISRAEFKRGVGCRHGPTRAQSRRHRVVQYVGWAQAPWGRADHARGVCGQRPDRGHAGGGGQRYARQHPLRLAGSEWDRHGEPDRARRRVPRRPARRPDDARPPGGTRAGCRQRPGRLTPVAPFAGRVPPGTRRAPHPTSSIRSVHLWSISGPQWELLLRGPHEVDTPLTPVAADERRGEGSDARARPDGGTRRAVGRAPGPRRLPSRLSRQRVRTATEAPITLTWPIIERVPELDRIDGALRTSHGTIIGGPPGVGKSTLLDQVARRWQRERGP